MTNIDLSDAPRFDRGLGRRKGMARPSATVPPGRSDSARSRRPSATTRHTPACSRRTGLSTRWSAPGRPPAKPAGCGGRRRGRISSEPGASSPSMQLDNAAVPSGQSGRRRAHPARRSPATRPERRTGRGGSLVPLALGGGVRDGARAGRLQHVAHLGGGEAARAGQTRIADADGSGGKADAGFCRNPIRPPAGVQPSERMEKARRPDRRTPRERRPPTGPAGGREEERRSTRHFDGLRPPRSPRQAPRPAIREVGGRLQRS